MARSKRAKRGNKQNGNRRKSCASQSKPESTKGRRRRSSSTSISPPPTKSAKVSENTVASQASIENSGLASPNIDINTDKVNIPPLLANSPLPLGYGNPSSGIGSGPGFNPEVIDTNITLDSIGGLKEQVAYIRKNILYPMEHKSDFEAFGIEPIKGVIFHGPPGTGKTLLAKALAAELSKNSTKINFFMRKGSDCYSKWVGESEKALRTLFKTAQAMKPSIIFLDELDGLCPARTDDGEGSHFYTTVVTCLLGLIDEIKRGDVFLIGATNRLDSLDAAIKRPGRFDKAIAFFPPNEVGRKQILDIKLTKWKTNKPSEKIITDLARRTVGFTGADLEQLCRDAFDCALDREMPDIGNPDNTKKEKSDVKKLQVLEADWNKALSKLGKSNSNVFGNSLYTGSVIDPSIRILINGIANEISAELKQFIRNENTISKPASASAGTGIKSFLVWGDSVPTVDVVDTFIFSSVVNTFDIEKTPGFIISEETLSTTPICTILKQVHNCRKGCFLFVPRIDNLWSQMVENGSQNVFRKSIEMTRATDIILVASSVCEVSTFPEELRSMFNGMHRTYKVRKPNTSERKAFFDLIFNPNSKFMTENFGNASKSSKCESERLEKLSARAQKLTQNDEIKSIMDLHGELTLACEKEFTDQKGLVDEFEEVLEEYEENKLGH